MRDTPIIRAEEFDPAKYLGGVATAALRRGQKYPKDKITGDKYKYLDIITSFDIETSSHQFEDGQWESWLYIWQWQFGDVVTVIGRTWIEFLCVVDSINQYLLSRGSCRILVYVHNLAFEFQFIAGVWNFAPEDVFATDLRSPLYCKILNLEFRCSLRLSNMNLDTWSKVLQTDHQKLVGNLDYSKLRFSDTQLTPDELAYCVHDVICVVECVTKLMNIYGDNIYSMPYTSTGYIRRRVRTAMKMWSPGMVRQIQPDLQTYDRLRQAFRGGDTHANRYWVGDLVGDVYSYDRSSSYPDVICHCKFPMSKFREEQPTFARLQQCLDIGRAVLMKISFFDIRLRDPRSGDPYIPFDKCSEPGYQLPINAEVDNGRIISADYLEIALTDIDFEIICHQYIWDETHFAIQWMQSARYGYLPLPFIDTVIDLYKQKTALKGIAGSEVLYNQSKAEINSCYGMMVQRLISNPVKFIDGEWILDEDFDRETEYEKAAAKSFLSYAWGCWVTCWARYRLYEGVSLCERSAPNAPRTPFIYADTDSVKCIGELDFSKFNARRIKDATRTGAFGIDAKGQKHYMGVFECDGNSDLFRTLGAKRYCTQKGDKLSITVAGVPKTKGSEYLKSIGGIEKFDFNMIFPGRATGKLGAVYDDHINELREVEGHKVLITRNVTLVEVDYFMTLYYSYRQLIEQADAFLDKYDYSDYNKRW